MRFWLWGGPRGLHALKEVFAAPLPARGSGFSMRCVSTGLGLDGSESVAWALVGLAWSRVADGGHRWTWSPESTLPSGRFFPPVPEALSLRSLELPGCPLVPTKTRVGKRSLVKYGGQRENPLQLLRFQPSFSQQQELPTTSVQVRLDTWASDTNRDSSRHP